MKKILYILLIYCTAALVSCSNEIPVGGDGADDLVTRGFMEVDLTTGSDPDSREEIHSVRLIVFNEASSATPLFEFNELIPVKGGSGTATEFSTTIHTKVGYDKMVFVVVNEPAVLSANISAVTTLGELENLSYTFANAMNGNAWTLAATGMPMTGVIRGVVVESENNPEFRAAKVEMVVERVVARVDFYLKVLDTGAKTGTIAGSTKITLENTYDRGPFVRGNQANGTWKNTAYPAQNFGSTQNIALVDLQSAVWTAGSTVGLEYGVSASNTLHVCSFYTAERLCATDDIRLKLVVENVKRGDDRLFGTNTFLLKEFTDENGSDAILSTIERNHVYQLVGTVKADNPLIFGSITVAGWTDSQNVVFPIN